MGLNMNIWINKIITFLMILVFLLIAYTYIKISECIYLLCFTKILKLSVYVTKLIFSATCSTNVWGYVSLKRFIETVVLVVPELNLRSNIVLKFHTNYFYIYYQMIPLVLKEVLSIICSFIMLQQTHVIPIVYWCKNSIL